MPRPSRLSVTLATSGTRWPTARLASAVSSHISLKYVINSKKFAMTDVSRDMPPLQKDALAAIGGALVIVQMAERMIKFCMQFVLPEDDEALTYEKLKSQEADEAKKTLGYFLGRLRQRVEVEALFDNQLREFLKMRNQLAHNLSEVPGLGFSEPKELEFAVKWGVRWTPSAGQKPG
jgi:hypothetical protein